MKKYLSVFFISFIGLFQLCDGQTTSSGTVDLERAFTQLKKINGGWFLPQDQGDLVEEWSMPDAQTLSGRNYRIRVMDGDTAAQKLMTIGLRPDGIFYTTRFRAINNNEPVDFKLVDVVEYPGERSFVFENIQYEYPKRIVYTIQDNRDLTIKYEGERNGRPRTEENVYQREFSAAEKEMYIRLGVGAFQMKPSGFFFTDPDEKEPNYLVRPGWELGAQLVFKGRGNFAKFGVEIGLAGRYAFVDSASFTRDTILFVRDDVRYLQNRVYVAFTPELRLDKNDRVSIFVGPYASHLLVTRTKGRILPIPKKDSVVYNANTDFKKSDFGIIGGFNFRLNPWKADLGGRIGLRAWLGLSNLDNFYTEGCQQCTGKVTQRGFSVSYQVNILK